MDNIKVEKVKINLSLELQKYIKAIIEEYGQYIPKERLKFLMSIDDYSQIIKIYDYGSINVSVFKDEINMPLCADRVLKI